MSNLAGHERIARHPRVEEWARRCSANSAAFTSPMKVTQVLEVHRARSPVVPLATHADNCRWCNLRSHGLGYQLISRPRRAFSESAQIRRACSPESFFSASSTVANVHISGQ
jgi:hypothetical protein